MWKVTIAAVVCSLMLGAVNRPAVGEEETVCLDQPKEKWVSAETVTQKLSRVIDHEFVLGVDKGCYEAEVIVNEVTMFDVYIDPVTLEIVKIRTEGESDS